MSSDAQAGALTARDLVLLAAVLALGSLVAWRAVYIPMTHDEASTWINYRHLDVWSCISNYDCWGTANNHWLNTLLLQWSASVFGDAPWALRLPNVLAGFGYGCIAALLCRRYTSGVLAGLGAWLALCGHVYLLDFFSLARGYGLMVFGVLGSMYALARYVEDYKIRWLVLALVAHTFAILANFTALLPWAAMGVAWGVWMLSNGKTRILFRHIGAWILHGALLFSVLRYPLKVLAGNGEFAWGAEDVTGTLRDLFTNVLNGQRYIGEGTVALLLSLMVVGVITSTALALANRFFINRRQAMIFFLLLVSNLALIYAQQKLTGSMAPVGRKSIYLIPLVFGVFVFSNGMSTRGFSWLGLLFVLLFVFHVTRVLPGSLKSCREWWYDAFYPALLQEILPAGAANDSIRLGTTWIFNPALSYYRDADALPIGGMPYERPLKVDSTMQYYFIEPSDTSGMGAAGFHHLKPIGPFFLFGNGRFVAPR
jgi:hypothetical protein